MNPISPLLSERRRSLTRSTSSRNLLPERSVSKPRRPQSSLSRAQTSHDLKVGPVEARSGTASGKEEDANEIENEEESSWSGIAEDLEQVIIDRRKRRKRGGSDHEEGDWEEEDGEKRDRESGNAILDSFEKMSLPSRDDDSHLSKAEIPNYFRAFGPGRNRSRKPEVEDLEEESKSWNPEVFTSKLTSRGAGGGRSHQKPSLLPTGIQRVCYEVPGERESWDAKGEIEMIENIGSPNSRWSFDKLVGSRSIQSRRDSELEKERSKKEGRTRAIDRLSLIEQQLSWVTV